MGLQFSIYVMISYTSKNYIYFPRTIINNSRKKGLIFKFQSVNAQSGSLQPDHLFVLQAKCRCYLDNMPLKMIMKYFATDLKPGCFRSKAQSLSGASGYQCTNSAPD